MIQVLGFIIGIQLTIRLLASVYRGIDLWYCISDHYPQIIKALLINLGLVVACYVLGNHLSSDAFLNGFMAGQIFFICYHIIIFWLSQLLVMLLR